ncbi:MAG: HAD-IA family hydrolase [Muribaculaceae bacterium]|nr:HAD-IA family hydrolase [Muribaculaceae bacterium]
MSFTEEIKLFLSRHHYNRVNPRAALIDMDGTLYDSMVNHTAAWHKMMLGLGVKCNRDEFYLYEGMTGAATINLLFRRAFGHEVSPEECARLYKRKTELFAEMPPVEPVEGAKLVMEKIMERGWERVLVTGSGQSSLINRLPDDYPGLFRDDMRITSHSVKNGKPHPEPYLKALELAGVKPWEAIVIENAPLGVKSGDSAGIFTIGVTTGPIPARELRRAGAAVVFDSMESFAGEFDRLIDAILNTSSDSNVN